MFLQILKSNGFLYVACIYNLLFLKVKLIVFSAALEE